MSRRLRLTWNRLLLPVRLDRTLPPAVREIMERLAGAGFEARLAGGAVRDLLLGQRPHDWDVVTSAPAAAIRALFPGGRSIGATRRGETVLIPSGGSAYEVTPYRGDGLAGDLARRDVTINAMALGLDGRLIDPFGGIADLAAGRLRACGDPMARFAEDPLRLLRAVRLAAQLDLIIEPATGAAIAALAPRLAEMAPERIGMEFGRLLVTPRPAWGMERLREYGLLAQFAPELLEMVGVEQNRFHAYPVWEHSLMALALVEPVLHLRLAALLHDVGKPRCVSVDEAGDRHFYRHEQVGAEMADRLLERLRFDGEASDAALRRMVSRIGLEHMDDLIQLRRADRLASGTRKGDLSPENFELLRRIRDLLERDACLKVTDLAVDGHDVMAAYRAGPGPYVGRVLQQLLDEVLEVPERNQREWLLERLDAMQKEGVGLANRNR